MKTHVIWLILLMLVSSLGVYSQKQDHIPPIDKRDLRRLMNPLIPISDTVIMLGEEIYIGAYITKNKAQEIRDVEIVGFGRSKKSDVEKGYFVIKQKPKQTTTYVIKYTSSIYDNTPLAGKQLPRRITVYVAKTKLEKSEFEKIIEEKRQKSRMYQTTKRSN